MENIKRQTFGTIQALLFTCLCISLNIGCVRRSEPSVTNNPSFGNEDISTPEARPIPRTYSNKVVASFAGIEVKLVKVSEPNIFSQRVLHISFDLGVYNKSTNYIEINAHIKNNSSESKTFRAGYIRVIHNGENLDYQPSIDGATGELTPLEKGNVIIVFEIPKEATGEMFWYPNGQDNVRFIIEKKKRKGTTIAKDSSDERRESNQED